MTLYNSMEELVGNTPLVKIDEKIHGLKNVELYAKLEYYNPYGSLKDRPAKKMLEPVIEDLKKKNKIVLEASSGNTAKALCSLAGIHGLKFKTVTNRIKYPEVREILQILDADIQELPGLSDCPDPNDPNDFTKVASDLENQYPDTYYYTDQYFSDLNWKAHFEGTGPEIKKDLGEVNYLIGTLGTCGSTYGAGVYLKQECNTKIIGGVAKAGQSIPGGRNMSELWEVGIFEKSFYDNIIGISTKDAIDAMLELNRKAGISGGPTTGLNYLTAIQHLKSIQSEKKIKAVFIACDRMEWYINFIKQFRPDIFDTNSVSGDTVENIDEKEIEKAPSISPEELKNQFNEHIVIDIRGHFAYTVGHVPGSMHILAEVFEKIIEEGKSFSKDSKITIVCTKGLVSKKFAAYLRKQDYQAYNLEGGLLNWKKQEYPLSKLLGN